MVIRVPGNHASFHQARQHQPMDFSEKWIQYSQKNLLPKEFKNLENQILYGDRRHVISKNELMNKNENLRNQISSLKNQMKKLEFDNKNLKKINFEKNQNIDKLKSSHKDELKLIFYGGFSLLVVLIISTGYIIWS